MSSRGKQLEELFQALGDNTRLRILNLLSAGELCVCYFVAILDEPQPKISRHLAYLRRSGLVAARRDGKWIHYRIASQADETSSRILQSILDELAGDTAMQRDVGKLQRACCAPRLPAALADAPRPVLGGVVTPSAPADEPDQGVLDNEEEASFVD